MTGSSVQGDKGLGQTRGKKHAGRFFVRRLLLPKPGFALDSTAMKTIVFVIFAAVILAGCSTTAHSGGCCSAGAECCKSADACCKK